MFIAGLINSILSFITFQHKDSQQVGCGMYLLTSSITSLLATTMLIIKFWFVIFTHINVSTSLSVLHGGCVSIEPILKLFLYLDGWLNACVAVERAVLIFKGNIPEDVVDYGSRSEFNDLVPPPVAPRRSRQNSACSVRYASFGPLPAAAPVRRCRVIESILLHVQRKKKTFEKILDIIKRREAITMFDLGLRFLRVYDGNFNYREGHE
ncbi:unnamed protein product, partial [Adineta steineri]